MKNKTKINQQPCVEPFAVGTIPTSAARAKRRATGKPESKKVVVEDEKKGK